MTTGGDWVEVRSEKTGKLLFLYSPALNAVSIRRAGNDDVIYLNKFKMDDGIEWAQTQDVGEFLTNAPQSC